MNNIYQVRMQIYYIQQQCHKLPRDNTKFVKDTSIYTIRLKTYYT